MTPALPPEIQVQLEQLRDIRLPEPVHWWPLAPGWWIAFGLICAVLTGGAIWSGLRKRTTRYLALRELERLDDGDPIGFVTALSALLRRVAIGRDSAAGQLQGTDWAGFLRARGMEPTMASHLAEAPYAGQAADAPSEAALRRAAAIWIRRFA